jgi:hypothetical protein
MKTNSIGTSFIQSLLFLLLTTLFLSNSLYAQRNKTGTIDYLKLTKGFKDIKLGADIRTLNVPKLSYLDDNSGFDADSCITFAIADSNFLKLRDVCDLDMIGIRTYKNSIVNIYLFFKKEDGDKILKEFLINYGSVFSKPNERINVYNWNANVVNLSLMYQANVDYGVAVFTYNPLLQFIAQEKKLSAIRNAKKQEEIQARELLTNTKNVTFNQ